MKMNEAKNKVKNTLKEQKRIYLMVIILLIIGILLGIVFSIIIPKSDHTLVTESLNTFFKDIKNNHINYTNAIINSLIGNIGFTLLLWLVGISIIGIPIIGIILVMKGFIFGFSISAIIYTYHLKGIGKAFGYIFPHQLLTLFFSIFLGFYAIYFSKKLFNFLFLKKEINLKHSMKRYMQVLLISGAGMIISSIIEVFISPMIINLFY